MCVTATALALFIPSTSNIGFAMTNEDKVSTIGELSSADSKTFTLDGYQINVNNQSEQSKYTLTQSGKTVESETIDFGYVEKLLEWDVDGENFLVVLTRETGSGAYANLHVYKLSEDAKEIFQSDKPYPKAKISVSDNQLEVTYPVFEQGHPLADPESFNTDKYVLANDTLTFSGTQNTDADQPAKTKSLSIQSEYQNPSWKEISDYLTEAAERYNIPPEIVKAIAMQESGWQQFWTYDPDGAGPKQIGDPVIGFDGRGLGIMQITLDPTYLANHPGLEDQLKYDYKTNIDWGVSILNDKWHYANTYTPTINDNDPSNIVNWYFAILAYNGMSQINDPHTNSNTYQDTIYGWMKKYGLIDVPKIPTSDLDIYYKPGSSRMYFDHKMHYTLSPDVPTKYNFSVDQVLSATISGVNVRQAPRTDAPSLGQLSQGEEVTVTGAPINPLERSQQYTYYPVKLKDGSTGYVASVYLTDDKVYPVLFKDLGVGPNAHGYTAVQALTSHEIIFGFGDGTFHPAASLTRLQAALMLVRALDLPTPDVTSTGFKDIPKSFEYAKQIAAVKKAGIFDGDGHGNFNPNSLLTRGQMAKVIANAYNMQHQSSYITPFKDIYGNIFKDYVETIYANGITNGITETAYGVNDNIKRVDFSIFLYRAIEKTGGFQQ